MPLFVLPDGATAKNDFGGVVLAGSGLDLRPAVAAGNSLDVAHGFQLLIDGTDYYASLVACTLTDAEGAALDTLTCELADTAQTLSFVGWEEIKLWADTTNHLFGGFVVEPKPHMVKGIRHWTLKCESYLTILNHAPKVRYTWVGQTAGYIAADLLTQAGITEIGTDLHVETGPTLDVFGVNGEGLAKSLDALALVAGAAAGAVYAWRVDADANLRFGPATYDSAPWSIAGVLTCDWLDSFPANKDPDVRLDVSDIRNRVLVRGGSASADPTTDNLTGDGATVLFRLSARPIREIVRITLAGTLLSHGTDWYDVFGGGYDVLVNYAAGTVRFPDVSPPALGAAIVVVFSTNAAITLQATDADSYAYYGRYFDYEYADPAVDSELQAAAIALAILDVYAFGVQSGNLSIDRLGLHGGQYVRIEYADLDLTGLYVIRTARTEIMKGGAVRCAITFGGRAERLSAVVGGAGSGGVSVVPGGGQSVAPYQQPTTPAVGGEVSILRVRGRIELIDPLTTYTEP